MEMVKGHFWPSGLKLPTFDLMHYRVNSKLPVIRYNYFDLCVMNVPELPCISVFVTTALDQIGPYKMTHKMSRHHVRQALRDWLGNCNHSCINKLKPLTYLFLTLFLLLGAL